MIRKLASGKYRLYSRKINPRTGKRRNLGTFGSRADALKHERAVQFFKRLWQNLGMPQAYASWAFLDEAGEARIRQNIKKLGPADWKSGEALWLIDMVAPFGGLDQALKDLRENVFPGKRMKMLQAAPGGGVAVVEW